MAPVTFLQWVECLDELKKGANDQTVISQLEQGTIEWTKGVAERLTQHLYETIECRLKLTSEILQKELDRSLGDETMIAKAILSARKRFALLKRVTELQAFPENVREALSEVLLKYAQSTQASLEKSALSDRTGRLRSLFINNNLTHFDKIENVIGVSDNVFTNQNEVNTNDQLPGIKSKKRRVILP